jgi:hypothetical protein
LASRIGTISRFGPVAALFLVTAAQESAAQTAYEACVNNARAVHDTLHAAECKRLAEQTGQDRADCLGKLKLPPTYCDLSYPARDDSANCTLPAENATVIDAAFERARYRCARENQAAQ